MLFYLPQYEILLYITYNSFITYNVQIINWLSIYYLDKNNTYNYFCLKIPNFCLKKKKFNVKNKKKEEWNQIFMNKI